MPNTNHKKESNMATSPVKQKSAIEDLLNDFDEIIEHAAETMTDEEFREAENKARELGRVPAASPLRHRESA
jgi:hypothetical protein